MNDVHTPEHDPGLPHRVRTGVWAGAVVVAAWVWFFSALADAFSRPVELAGVFLFWPFVAGLHLLGPLSPPEGLQAILAFALPSGLIGGYVFLIGVAVARIRRRQWPLHLRALGLASLVGVHAALAAVAYPWFLHH